MPVNRRRPWRPFLTQNSKQQCWPAKKNTAEEWQLIKKRSVFKSTGFSGQASGLCFPPGAIFSHLSIVARKRHPMRGRAHFIFSQQCRQTNTYFLIWPRFSELEWNKHSKRIIALSCKNNSMFSTFHQGPIPAIRDLRSLVAGYGTSMEAKSISFFCL